MGPKPKTRHASGSKMSDLLGPGKEFTLSELPTLREVLRYGIWLRLENTEDQRNYNKKEMAKDIVNKVLEQWARANNQFKNPVILSEKTLCDKVVSLWDKAFRLANEKMTAAVELKKFYSGLDRLFDITKCCCSVMTCQETTKCSGCLSQFHINCDCSKEQKIPVLELGFIRAQREKIGTFSKMMIANRDDKETKKQNKTAERKEQLAEQDAERQSRVRAEFQNRRAAFLSEEAECGGTESQDTSWEVAGSGNRSGRNMTVLKFTAQASIRHGVSARATADIGTSVLIDYGVIKKDDTEQVIGPKKIQR